MKCSPKSCGEATDNMEEGKSCHPIPPLHNANSEVTRSLREIPPAHFIFKIEKLSFYPNGDKTRKGEGHISLYLVIAETSNLPIGWEVNVNFKLFVYDQIQDKYMTIQDANGKVRRFHGMKTECGFAQLLPLNTFNDADNGYLICDTCIFGAEVFVINYTGRGQSINILKELDCTYTWKIDNFSSLDGQIHYSDVFTFGNRKWNLQIYPKGDLTAKDKCMSLFLGLDDLKTFPSERKTYAKYKMRIKNQYHGEHIEIEGFDCFTSSSISWGTSSLLSLSDLHDASKGFLVNDTLIVEAEVSAISTVKNFSV
ncbi:unnamed protein product [Camellia sinensis]